MWKNNYVIHNLKNKKQKQKQKTKQNEKQNNKKQDKTKQNIQKMPLWHQFELKSYDIFK